MNLFLQANAEGGIAGFLPLIAILAVMYFFFLRPQMKRQKEETKFRNVLAKGMRVVTSGKISDLDEHTFVLESENSRLRFERSSVSKELTAARFPESAKVEEKK
jgi:preprotein translocase subunit YajC